MLDKKEVISKSVKLWRTVAILLGIFVILLLLNLTEIVISSKLIGLISIIIIFYLAFQIYQQKSKLDIYELAKKVAATHLEATGEILDTREIVSRPCSGGQLIGFPKNTKSFMVDDYGKIVAKEDLSMFVMGKEYEDSFALKTLLAEKKAKEIAADKMEQMGLEEKD